MQQCTCTLRTQLRAVSGSSLRSGCGAVLRACGRGRSVPPGARTTSRRHSFRATACGEVAKGENSLRGRASRSSAHFDFGGANYDVTNREERRDPTNLSRGPRHSTRKEWGPRSALGTKPNDKRRSNAEQRGTHTRPPDFSSQMAHMCRVHQTFLPKYNAITGVLTCLLTCSSIALVEATIRPS